MIKQGVEKQASGRQPCFRLRASGFQSIACEHLQKPHNAGSRPPAQFFNILRKIVTTIPVAGGVASL
jgi:hypothetical protein